MGTQSTAVAFRQRKKQMMRAVLSAVWLAVAVASVGAGMAAAPGAGDAQATYEFNLPVQGLADSLRAIAQLTATNILFDPKTTERREAPEVRGSLTADGAVERVIAGTGLRAKRMQDLIVVKREGDKEWKAAEGEDKAGAGQEQGGKVELQEIVVTAQKRTERLQDVPASVSAIGNDRLNALHINSLSDLSDYIPGMSVEDGGAPGARQISIRGLNTTNINFTTGPTVGTYVDDIAVGCSTGGIGGARCGLYGVDLNPSDIKQIEVLKGPQGTLYGATSLGGLIKYSLYSPDLTRFYGGVAGDVRYTDGSSRPGGGGNLFVNVPIVTDKLAVRLSGFYKNAAGWIDNIGIGATNVNHSTEEGGTAMLLWQAADRIAVKATIIAQDVDAANATEEDFINGTTPAYDPPGINRKFPEGFKPTTRVYSLGVDWNMDFATLTSATGWSEFNSPLTTDFSALGQFCVPGSLGGGWPGCPSYPQPALVDFFLTEHVEKFVEELRLASSGTQRLQWMLGGFYTRERSKDSEEVLSYTQSYVPLPYNEDFSHYLGTGVYEESAAFANATFKLTDRWDIGGGGRYSSYKRSACQPLDAGLFGPAGGFIPCESLPATGVAVWMANANLHLSSDAMLYARVSTGYRPGSGCPTCGNPVVNTPGEVNPDKTTNYEVGLKGTYLDNRLQLQVAGFYIDWKDIQLTLFKGVVGYAGNGGGASSSGFEATTVYRITNHLELNANLARTDAHLTEDVTGVGNAGDQLPMSPLWTAAVSLDYTHPVGEGKALQCGGDYRYRDKTAAGFASQPGYASLIPQNIAGLYAGLRIKDVTTRLYATNIFNNHSFVGGGISASGPATVVPVLPRTIGVTFDYRF